MNEDQLRALLEQVRAGAMNVDAAVARVRHLPFEDLGFAKVDHHRELRHGMPEVILGKGKTPDQVLAIAGICSPSQNVLITRADAATATLVRQELRRRIFSALRRHPVLARQDPTRQRQNRRRLRRHERHSGRGGSANHRRSHG